MSKLSSSINRNWFANTEILLIASSIGSSVAAIIFQQVAFAAITSLPLSLAISLNSHNRRRIEEVERQYKASVTHLEQKFSDKQEFTDKVLYSLPTRSELSDLEKRLEAYRTTFTEELSTLNQQSNLNLELHKIDIDRKKIVDVQQRLYVLESLLQSYNPTDLNPELQETLVSFEGKVKKLELQFNNLPLSNLQQQFIQLQQIVNKLQVSSTEATQLDKCLLGEIHHISQQFQSVNSKTQELSFAYTEMRSQINLLEPANPDKIFDQIKFLLFNDSHTGIAKSTEINQHLVEEVQSIHQQIQAVSSSVSERIKALQVELQTQRLFVEKSERKIHEDLYELADWYKNLENELKKLGEKSGSTTSNKVQKSEVKVSSTNKIKYVCDHCHRNYEHQPIEGGYFFNNKFCRPFCKKRFELQND